MHSELNAIKYTISQAKCTFFTVFNMINIILNNVLFFFISIVIDIGLIRFAKQNLERKLNISSLGELHGVNQAKNLKEKVTKMIIVNGLLFFVSHVPEFVVTLVMLALHNQLAYKCMNEISCLEMIDIAQTFNFLSMGLQLLVFKHFDKNFNKSLEDLLNKTRHSSQNNKG